MPLLCDSITKEIGYSSVISPNACAKWPCNQYTKGPLVSTRILRNLCLVEMFVYAMKTMIYVVHRSCAPRQARVDVLNENNHWTPLTHVSSLAPLITLHNG